MPEGAKRLPAEMTHFEAEALRVLNDIDGLMKENNSILKENNKILKMDHTTILGISENVRKININTGNIR
jgi:hypothetical protein